MEPWQPMVRENSSPPGRPASHFSHVERGSDPAQGPGGYL